MKTRTLFLYLLLCGIFLLAATACLAVMAVWAGDPVASGHLSGTSWIIGVVGFVAALVGGMGVAA